MQMQAWGSPLRMITGLGIRPGEDEFKVTPTLKIIDRALYETINTPDSRLLISVAPQEGKSTLVSRGAVLWALWMNRHRRIVLVSYGDSLARSISGQVRTDVITYQDQLGMSIRQDTRAKNEWRLTEGGGVYAIGIGGGVSGRPADLLIIDDPVKDRATAESQAHRRALHDWWTSVGSARLGPGAPVIVVATRYHEDDLIGHLLAGEDGHRWRYINIPAEADHDPSKGEIDILGRKPGEFMISARGRSRKQWLERKIQAGSRDWAAMYQGRPSPLAGDILKRHWWRYYEEPMWVGQNGTRWVPPADDQEMIITVDCAFKDLDESDYVAIGVWLRRGPNMYLLDLDHDHMDFPETCRRIRAMIAKWPQADLKLIEAAANGFAVIATLRAQIPGIVPETVTESKIARAHALTPFLEAGNVWLPDPILLPRVTELVEEAAGFPNGAHDDYVDITTMAGKRLLVAPFIADQETEDQEMAEADLRGYAFAPY